MQNSNNGFEPNNDIENNSGELQPKEKKTISDTLQYIIGAVSGLLTGATIYVSGLDLNIQDQLINKLIDYAFLIVFVLFMIITRKYETNNDVSLKKTKTAYMIAMLFAIAVFFYLATTQPR